MRYSTGVSLLQGEGAKVWNRAQPSRQSGAGEGPESTQLSRCPRLWRAAGMGHLERFPSERVSARYVIR